MSPTLAASVAAAVASLATATDRDAIRQILADWRAAHWDAWVEGEAAAHTEDARWAERVGNRHLLEADGTWRVDYLPGELHLAESAALARTWTADVPAVYTRTRD